jgi:hypothetical protein
MIRLLPAALAVALAAAPAAIMPAPPMVVTALAGLLLAALGIAARWRWPATAAAAVFLVDYTAALWLADARVSIAGAACFGLGLLYLLQSLDLAGRVHRTAADTAVIRSHLGRCTGFGAATLGAAALLVAVASALAAPMPPAVAPILAAAGALGVVAIIAVFVIRAATRSSIRPEHRRATTR